MKDLNVALRDTRLMKCAAIAGTALALPIAAHAGPVTVAGPGGPFTDPSSFQVDIDNNGVNDFQFDVFSNLIGPATEYITVLGLGSNQVVGSGGFASPLAAGASINGSSTLTSGSTTLAHSQKFLKMKAKGPWPQDGSFAYLGVEFQSGADTLYGWMHISATTDNFILGSGLQTSSEQLTIDQMGYESTPGGTTFAGGEESASVPEPATLSLLSLGAAGISAVRARRRKNS
jgi:hypothetical protein